jgi:hypothetical protein
MDSSMTLLDEREVDYQEPAHPSQRQRGSPRIAPNRDGTVPAGRVVLMMLATLLLGALLCADTLVQVAEQRPFGPGRDAALFVTRPLKSVSHAVGLHLPRLWLAEWTDNEDLPTSASGADIEVAGPTTTVTTVAVTPGLDDKGSGQIATTTTTTAVPVPTTLPPRRVPSAEAPLRVAMYGDSLMGNISEGFGRLVRGDPRVTLHTDFRVSTGLARPDVLDWPAYLQMVLPSTNPEIVYLQFGGNDDQAMQRPDGSIATLGSPEWREEYARRVGLVMDVAGQGDRTVVWLGLPAERPPQLHMIKEIMNEVAREQASLRPRVVYVDTVPVLSPGGVYSEVITTPDGRQIDTRAGDGVHLSQAGADLLAPTLLAAIATDWNLAVPGPTAPPPPTTAPPATAPVPPPPVTDTTLAPAPPPPGA